MEFGKTSLQVHNLIFTVRLILCSLTFTVLVICMLQANHLQKNGGLFLTWHTGIALLIALLIFYLQGLFADCEAWYRKPHNMDGLHGKKVLIFFVCGGRDVAHPPSRHFDQLTLSIQ